MVRNTRIPLTVMNCHYLSYYSKTEYEEEVYKMMEKKELVQPFEDCNFIEPNLLIGAFPYYENYEMLVNYGFTIFVNLTKTSYRYPLNKKITLIQEPIKGGSILSKEKTEDLLSQLIEYYKEGKKIYIHCRGGHGRAGTLASLLIGRLRNYNAAEALQVVQDSQRTRLSKKYAYVPTPETMKQLSFIIEMLGLPKGFTLPYIGINKL